jgi:transcriptional regulator with XRE-family HTH domain
MKTELSTVLRAWRDRTSPEEAGMPRGTSRRAPGLRREELAALACLSVDYLVQLEQGRATSPSPQVLQALARALRLSTEERDHLFRVGSAPLPSKGELPRYVTPSIQRIVDRLGDTPVSVFSAAWDTLLWNPLWAALLGDPSRFTGNQANLIWRYFLSNSSRVVHEEQHAMQFKRDMVADLRAAYGRYPADAALSELIAQLRASSGEFEAIWRESNVGLHISGRKLIDNPLVGRITLDCDVLASPGSDLRVVVYTARPGTEDSEKLDVLRVAGLQIFDYT